MAALKLVTIAALLVLLLVLGAQWQPAQADIPSHLITSLPGQPDGVKFRQYAGYITVDAARGRRFFYYFAESQNNPEKDPVVLWLNGGPGCSSVIGLLGECGPYFAGPDGKSLLRNPWSWNRNANTLFLESPAGVGFSYSDTPSDYEIGDAQTAKDNRRFLLNWFSNFSEYSKNEFYITGESYAGHYIPTLTMEILQGNQNPAEKINLVGIAVGNGLTDQYTDFNSVVPMTFWHGLFSSQAWDQIQTECKGDYVTNNSPACQVALSTATRQIGDIDPYNLYATVCRSSRNAKDRGDNQMMRMLRYHPLYKFAGPSSVRAKGTVMKMQRDANVQAGMYDGDPCIDDYMTEYMNLPSVQTALHVKPMRWLMCSNSLNYNFSVDSMLPYYQHFFDVAPQLRILIYSGDVDTVLPFLGTQTCTRMLNRPLAEAWRPWYIEDATYGSQVAGYVVKYDKFFFVTVKGAGHEVPFFQPQAAWEMIDRFIQRRPF